MAGKKQIVSFNFTSNFVFVGWKWNLGWGWCTVGGRAYWNSARFVSQTCLTTQSHKHTCTQTGCRIWGHSELGSPLAKPAFPPSFSLLACGSAVTPLSAALLFSPQHFLSASEPLPSLLWTVSWISALFFILSPHTCISLRVSLGSTNQTTNIYGVLAMTTGSPLFPSTLMVIHNKSSKVLFASCHFSSWQSKMTLYVFLPPI